MEEVRSVPGGRGAHLDELGQVCALGDGVSRRPVGILLQGAQPAPGEKRAPGAVSRPRRPLHVEPSDARNPMRRSGNDVSGPISFALPKHVGVRLDHAGCHQHQERVQLPNVQATSLKTVLLSVLA